MNRCFIIGKILNEPEFDFLYMNKNISISYFEIELSNGSIIKTFGYDKKADYIYRSLKKGDNIIIDGKIRNENNTIKIEIDKIEKLTIAI